ncbi:MAG: hypothetical protein GY932_07470 [Arcobacter sp.]|nr:hypothetical protein [Arcobacter sp.]
MGHTNSDEIDLGIVFNKIKQGFNNILISLFKGFQFLLKHWWIIIILALAGGIIGYFIEKNNEPNKETTIIVQNNFNSSSYVYNAIEQLNNKIKEGDTIFLQEAGFKSDIEGNIIIQEIEIEPIVNIIELMDKSVYNYRTLEPFLQEAEFKEDLLTSEVFFTEYKFHKISLQTSSFGDQKTIQSVVAFLNNNELLNKLKKAFVISTQERIESFNKTIKHIDDVMEAFPEKEVDKTKGDQIFISTGSNYPDLGELVQTKLNILNQRERFVTEIVKYDEIVVIMNKPVFQDIRALSKKTKYVLLFVFSYLFFFLLKSMYFNIKHLAEKK